MKTLVTQQLILSLIFFIAYNATSQNLNCFDGYFLCNNDKVHIEGAAEYIKVDDENNCMSNLEYIYSVSFFVNTATDNNNLIFNLTPDYQLDDLDFQVYEISPINYECNEWELIRCNASGPRLSLKNSRNNCFGSTGLMKESTDRSEERGCANNSDGYLSPVTMEKGKIYVIKVMNATSESGFTLELDQSTELANHLPSSEVGDFFRPLVTQSSSGAICYEFLPPFQSNEVLIYPNPTSDFLNIHSLNAEMTLIQAINLSGQAVLEKSLENSHIETLNISNLTPGLYNLLITTDSGITETKPFVKID